MKNVMNLLEENIVLFVAFKKNLQSWKKIWLIVKQRKNQVADPFDDNSLFVLAQPLNYHSPAHLVIRI